ncbi:MAG: hypothetical protein GY696_37265, partial [Gammaproteobacteria bacterium]|nr:hypothetical protein [Gammaproteobacteria bacterium]
MCQGEETKEGDKLTKNALVLMELRVLCRNKKFLASHNCKSKSEHMKLPGNMPELRCQTGCRTYVWEDSNHECPLHRIQTMTPSLTRQMIDHQHQMLLNQSAV